MTQEVVPQEPGVVPDPSHGLADPGVPVSDEDDSDDDEGCEVNDYDAFPDDPDDEED